MLCAPRCASSAEPPDRITLPAEEQGLASLGCVALTTLKTILLCPFLFALFKYLFYREKATRQLVAVAWQMDVLSATHCAIIVIRSNSFVF